MNRIICSQKLDPRDANKHFTLQNQSISYTCKNITQQYKNNKTNNSSSNVD